MEAVVVTRSVDLAAPPERVWPLVSDTDRFNRLLGMSEVRTGPSTPPTRAARASSPRRARAASSSPTTSCPSSGRHERAFSVHRRMHGGPVESFTWRCTLERTRASDGDGALEGGTRATVRLEIVPRATRAAPRRVDQRAAVRGAASRRSGRRSTRTSRGRPEPLRRARRRPPTRSASRRPSPSLRERRRRPGPRRAPRHVRAPRRRRRRGARPALRAGRRVGARPSRGAPRVPARGPRGARSSCAGASSARAASRRREQARSLEEHHAPRATASSATSRSTSISTAPSRRRSSRTPPIRRVPEALFCMGGPGRTPHVLVQAGRRAGRDARARRAGGARALPRVRARRRHGDARGRRGRRARRSTPSLSPDGIDPAHLHAAPGGELRIASTRATTAAT